MDAESGSKKTHELLCQEYVVQAERVRFYLQKEKMMLRVEEPDSKDREYIVVSMTPRSDSILDDSERRCQQHLYGVPLRL